MARIRTVKPEFWADEKLGPMPSIDRLVFLGLISQADDAGRILDSVKLIDGLLFPYTDDSVCSSLANLSRLGVIDRGVAANGKAVIQIVNWERHQKVDKPNMAAALPDIVQLREDDSDSRISREYLANSSRAGKFSPAGNDADNADDLDKDKVNHKPESLPARPNKTELRDQNPNDSRDIRDALARDSRPIPTINDQRSKRTAALRAAEFDKFWKLYPKRAGGNPKANAIRAWNARIRQGVSPAELVNGLRRYVQYCVTSEVVGTQYVLQAATFLGPNRRWEDAWEAPPGKGNGKGESFRGYD